MITGFNTDVEYEGKKFHVQTQEQGQSNPVVETLVYAGGEIVTFVANSYADIVEASGHVREAILERMEDQHESLIHQILTGKFDAAPKPYGHDEVTGRSLDEVVIDYLDDSAQLLAEVQDQLIETEPDPTDSTEPSDDVKAHRLRQVLTRLEQRIEKEKRPAKRDTPAVATRVEPTKATPMPVAATRTTGTSGRIWAVAAIACAILAVVMFGVNGERFEASRSAPGGGEYSRAAEARRPADSRIVVPAAEAPVALSPGASSPEPEPIVPVELAPPPTATAVKPKPVRPISVARAEKPSPPTTSPEPIPEPTIAKEPPVEIRDEPVEETLTATPDTTGDVPVIDAGPEPAAAEPQETIAVSPTRRGQLVDYSEIDVAPVPVRRDLPRYTRKARRQGRQGVMEMRILVIENGRVAGTKLVEDIPGSDLGAAALEAANTWQFTPARKDGVPVRVWKTVRVRFTISSKGKAIVRVEE